MSLKYDSAIHPAPQSNSPQSSIKSLFQEIDLNWRSPESGDLWYKSRQMNKTIRSPSESRSGLENAGAPYLYVGL